MIRYAATFVFITMLVGGCSDPQPSSKRSVAADKSCSFVHSRVAGSSCNVSVLSLAAYPERYENTRVFTYAYMFVEEIENHRSYNLMYEPRFRASADFASCVTIKDQIISDDLRLSTLAPGKFYSVALAGDLALKADRPCVASLSSVDFADIALEQAPP